MNWADFNLGFWHPFGPYCGLSVEEILKWKQGEVERPPHWTFWSFAYASSAEKWYPELLRQSGPIYVLCSHSPTAIDPWKPGAKPIRATRYKFFGAGKWEPMPTEDGAMFVINPFKRGPATAFKVTGVEIIEPYAPDFKVEWFARSEDEWSSHPLPTRGEFLVRRGGQAKLRSVCAVLEISSPYLAVIDCEISKG